MKLHIEKIKTIELTIPKIVVKALANKMGLLTMVQDDAKQVWYVNGEHIVTLLAETNKE